MSKQTWLTVAAVSVLSGGLVVATNAYAQTPTAGQNTVPSLVKEIADTFHLSTNDVQAVFTKHHQQLQSEREANYEAYLQNLINSGKITKEQQQLLLNKHKELVSQLQSNKQNFKNMTPEERKAQMQSTQQNLQNWAKQNTINLQYLRPLGIGKKWVFKFGKTSITPTPTQ